MYWLRDLDGRWVNLAQAECIDASIISWKNDTYGVTALINGEEYVLWEKKLESHDGKHIEQVAAKANIFLEALMAILIKDN